MTPAPEIEHGKTHGRMLDAATDTMNRLTTLPRLMVYMLREDGWRVLSRPIDGKIFTNRTVEDWILGEPWPGLHFPDWATTYALLERNLDVGQECIERLQKAGAPKPAVVEAQFQQKVHKKLSKSDTHAEAGAKGGRGKKALDNIKSFGGTDPIYVLRRLKRDRADLADEVIAGRLSANAAAKQAGFRKATWTAPADFDALRAAIAKRFGWVLTRK